MKTLTYTRLENGGTRVTANHVRYGDTAYIVSGRGATKAKARKALERKLRVQAGILDDALHQIQRDIEREEA